MKASPVAFSLLLLTGLSGCDFTTEEPEPPGLSSGQLVEEHEGFIDTMETPPDTGRVRGN